MGVGGGQRDHGDSGVCKSTYIPPCGASLWSLEYLKVSVFIANGGVLYSIYLLSSQMLWISDKWHLHTYSS